MEDMNFREFLIHVDRATRLGSDEAYKTLKTTGYLEEDQGSMGGFTVPTQAWREILDVTLEESIVRPQAKVITMESDSLEISRLVDASHASTVLGGIAASWIGEAATMTESNPAFGTMLLTAHKIYGFCYTSVEWIDDSIVPPESLLRQAFGEAIAFYTDAAYFTGSGVAEPLGVINAACTIPVAKEGSQTADTVFEENIRKMDVRLDPRSQRAAKWYINQEVKDEFFPLQNSTPADSLLQPEMSDGDPYLMWHPIVVTEKCPQLGDLGDIILADFRRYLIADRGLTVRSSKGVKFASDQIAWSFTYRGDGQPIPAAPYIPKNATSSTTVAPFVTLAERAA